MLKRDIFRCRSLLETQKIQRSFTDLFSRCRLLLVPLQERECERRTLRTKVRGDEGVTQVGVGGRCPLSGREWCVTVLALCLRGCVFFLGGNVAHEECCGITALGNSPWLRNTALATHSNSSALASAETVVLYLSLHSPSFWCRETCSTQETIAAVRSESVEQVFCDKIFTLLHGCCRDG